MSHKRFYTSARQYGNSILVRGWDDRKGGHFDEKIPFRPTMYLPSKTQTEFTTLDGEYVSPVQPGNIKETKKFIDDYSNVSGMKVYGMEKFLYQYLAEEFDDNIEYDSSKIKLWSLDIETASENGFPKPELAEEEVLLITLKNFNSKKMITFGSRPWERSRDDVDYILCEDERNLLDSFVAWWETEAPEVITRWNVDLFDMTYLCNRIARVMGEKAQRRLSPWGLISMREVENFGRTQQKFEIGGVSILDYLDVYKKFTYTNRESYRLDVIAEIELGQKKLDHSEFDTFKDFYTKGWNKFVDYNMVDVDLVDRLEEKMKLIDLVMLMAYDAHVNYTDCFGMVKLWDVIIYNDLRKRGIVLAPRGNTEKASFPGGYVKQPVPGNYKWVVSFDLNSLYPSLIRFLNISPETLVEGRRHEALAEDYEKDMYHYQVEGDTERSFECVRKVYNKEADLSTEEGYTVGANGAMYSKDKVGFMPEIITRIYNERKQYKKTMLQCKQKLVDINEEIKRRGL